MGWGTDFTANIFLSKQTFNSIYEVEDEIEDKVKYAENLRQQIKMFSAANLSEIAPDDWKEDIVLWANIQLSELLKDLKETEIAIYKLNLYKEYLTDKE